MSRRRPIRIALVVAAGLLVVVALGIFWTRYERFAASDALGIDYRLVAEFGHRLHEGSPYLGYQLTGPYLSQPMIARPIADAPMLYPPPFALAGLLLDLMPWPIWWLVPLAILGYAVYRWRPALWSWPILALIACWPWVSSVLIVGGTTMWIVALVAAGLLWHWPAALLILKPTFAPLALIGIRNRNWWIVLGLLGVASLLTAPLWSDYVKALHNASDLSFTYSFGDLPLIAFPLVAWAARTGPPLGGRILGKELRGTFSEPS